LQAELVTLLMQLIVAQDDSERLPQYDVAKPKQDVVRVP